MLDAVLAAARAFDAHSAWWGPALGLAAVVEGLVLVGAVIPVTPLLVWLGAALARGGDPWPLLWAVAGAAVGTGLSFELGRRVGLDGVTRFTLLAKARALAGPVFGRRGGAAIVLSRLIGGAAGLVSFGAGLARMPRAAFYARSLWANVLWVGGMAGAGYLGALGWRTLTPRLTAPLLLGLLALAAVLVGLWARWRRALAARDGAQASPA